MKLIKLVFALILVISVEVNSADLFVSKTGKDTNDGLSSDTAFLTINKGVQALGAGNTLSIGPGEYFESIFRKNLGNIKNQTVIKAEVAGTVLLRGDVPAPQFEKVDGYRFVYSATFDSVPQAVLEVDSLETLTLKPNVPILELNPGTFYYDKIKKVLYISSSDMAEPKNHYYRISVTAKSGIHFESPKNVLLEGLAATGYNTTLISWHVDSVWGFRMDSPVNSIIRNCTTFLNSGGITLWGGGEGNVIEFCTSYGNFPQNVPGGSIRRFGGSTDVIRNCYAYKSRARGISFYGKGKGDVLLKNNISWGHSLHDFRIKGHGSKGTAKAVSCFALGNGMVHDIENSLVASNGYRLDGMSDDNIIHTQYYASRYNEYADSDNLDYRLQSTSQLRGAGKGGSDIGPYPYTKNVFFVRPDGDDNRDGTSARLAKKSLETSVQGLKEGDTLYLEPGNYEEGLTVNTKGITFKGRKRQPVVIQGESILNAAENITFNRINFIGKVNINNCKNVEFKNCTFKSISSSGSDVLKITHCIIEEDAELSSSKSVNLRGNIYLQNVKLGNSSPVYSDYNCYLKEAAKEKMPDKFSLVFDPEVYIENNLPVIKSKLPLLGKGPLGTNIGIYLPYTKQQMKFKGPFIHSVTQTTANLECWSSVGTICKIKWGTTPDCENAETIKLAGFGSLSLTGLEPGLKYPA